VENVVNVNDVMTRRRDINKVVTIANNDEQPVWWQPMMMMTNSNGVNIVAAQINVNNGGGVSNNK